MTLSEKIEAEYQQWLQDPERGVDEMYRLLDVYLKKVAAPVLTEGGRVRWDVVEDLVQDALLYILNEGLTQFEKREARFASWCAVIVKNRALDWVRKQSRHRMELLEDDVFCEPETLDHRGNPEKIILELERKVALCEDVKCYLRILVNQDAKPYQTVSYGFSTVLFQLYCVDSKELTSPGWAYERLQKDTVGTGANRFLNVVNDHFPLLKLRWGEAFLEGLKKQERGMEIRLLVFGEHFKVKDFENWSRRMREKIRRDLVAAEREKQFGLEL